MSDVEWVAEVIIIFVVFIPGTCLISREVQSFLSRNHCHMGRAAMSVPFTKSEPVNGSAIEEVGQGLAGDWFVRTDARSQAVGRLTNNTDLTSSLPPPPKLTELYYYYRKLKTVANTGESP